MPNSSLVARFEWDSTYHTVKLGQARFRLPIKSLIPLLPGYKFWIPVRRSKLVNNHFVRPIWKPRNSPDYIQVKVVRVIGDELFLHRVPPLFKPRM